MKELSIRLNKRDIESILKGLILYRLSLLEESSEFSETYIDSLSHTGYLLELIKNQSYSEDINEEAEVSLDIETYLNIYDILVYQIDVLNKSIIDNLEIDNRESANSYKEEKKLYKALYRKINVRKVDYFKNQSF